MEIRILEPIPWQDGSWSESGDIIDSDELEPGILDQLLNRGAAEATGDEQDDAGEAGEATFDDGQDAAEVIGDDDDYYYDDDDDDDLQDAGAPSASAAADRAKDRRGQPKSFRTRQGPAVSSQPRTEPVLPPVLRAVVKAHIKQLCMTRKTPESNRSSAAGGLLALATAMKRQRQTPGMMSAGRPPTEHEHQQFSTTLKKKINRIKGTSA